MKKKIIVIIAVCAILLLALAATGVALWLNNQPDAPEQNSDLRVDLITVIPAAYMNEQYDLKQIIEMQEGVEYSAQVFYQNYDTMEEFELPLTDLVFCQKEDFDVNVIFTAKRGEEIAQRALNIPVNIRADEIDELFSTNGLAGYADSGIVKNLNVDPQYLVNKDSKTSLVVGFQGASTHDYGHVIMSLAKEAVRPLYTDQSWENAAVSFWVYNPLEFDVEFQMRLVYTEFGVDTDWTNREDADRRIAKPGQWTQIVFSLRKYGIEKMVTSLKDHVQVKMQYLGRPARGEQYAYSVYIDGIDIVDASAFPDLDTNSTVSNESIEQGWENLLQDGGWQSARTIFDHDTVMGEGSTCSLHANFPEVNVKEGYFVVLSPERSRGRQGMKNLPDMTAGTLTGYFKFENASPGVEVYLVKWVNGKWMTSNRILMDLEAVGDGWYKGSLDVYGFEFPSDRNDEIIRVVITFTGARKGSEVWMDTLKFAPKDMVKVKESARKDWINLPTDGGMSKGTYYNYTLNRVKAEGSIRSVKIIAPRDKEGTLVFNPHSGVEIGMINKLPDMRKGTLHAWFYFGKQEPKASVRVYNDKWGSSNRSSDVDFIFEDNGDGWYYGSVPASLLESYYVGDGSQILRVALIIPAGYTVYVDGLMHYPQEVYKTTFDPDDLFASGLFITEGIKQGNGYAFVTDVTNGSADAVTMWATEKTGWPKVGIKFTEPVDFSSYTHINLDVKNIYSDEDWVGVYVDYLDADGNVKRAGVGTEITGEEWHTISIPLAKFANADMKNVMGVMVCANFQDRLKEGVLNQLWYDNLHLTVKDPPPTPQNPVATEEDTDLISGSYTATADIAGIRGILKVAADDEGQATSNSMLLMWANSPSGWPRATFLFDNEQDWSNMEYLTLDTKIIGTHPWVSVEIINRAEDGSLVYSKGGAYDTTTGAWNTHRIYMYSFRDVDLSKVCGIRINVNLQEELTEGTLAQVYIDNVNVVEKPVLLEDNDLLATSQVICTSVTKLAAYMQSDVTNNSNQALKMEVTGDGYFQWPKATLTLQEAVSADVESFTVDVERTCSDLNFRVEFLDANDVVLGNHVIGTEKNGWQTHTFKLSELSVDPVLDTEITQIAKIRFTFYLATGLTAGDAMYLDNAAFLVATDTDLLGTSQIAYASVSESTKLSASMQSGVTNNSNQALKMEVTGDGYFRWPKATLTLQEAVSAAVESFTVDVERTCSDLNFRVEFLDANDVVLGNHVVGTEENGWQTHTFKLSELSVDPVLDTEITQIAKIRFTFYLAEGLTAGDAMYLDNAAFISKADTDLLGTSQITYTSVNQLTASMQSGVTNNSNQALKMEVTGDGYFRWPKATLTLQEAVSADVESFTVDVERTCSDLNFRVEFLDANDVVLGNHVIGTEKNGWQTHTFKLSELSVDPVLDTEITQIAKIRFTFYLATGLTAGDAMYLDNAAFLVATDTDLLGTSQITYTSVNQLTASMQSGVTNNSNQALKMEVTGDGYFRWPKATLTLQDAVSAAVESFTVDVERTCSDLNFRVEFLDANDVVLGNHVVGTEEDGWQTHTFKLSELSVDPVLDTEITQIAKIRFTFYLAEGLTAGDAMYLDNAAFISKADTDLLGTSQITYTSVNQLTASMQSGVTNNSNQALKMEVTGDGYFRWPKATLTLQEAVSAAVENFTVDVERTCSDLNFRVEFLDANDVVLGNHVVGTEEDGWQTHTFKLSELSVDPVLDTEITQIAKIRFTFYLAEGLNVGDAMYLDNVAFISDKDLISNSTITYTQMNGVTGFVQTEVTNDSNEALAFERTDAATYNKWPVATLTLVEPVSEGVDSFNVDVEGTYSSNTFRVKMLDASGTQLGNHLVRTITSGWQSLSFKLSEMNVDPITDDEISKIAKVQLLLYLPDGLESGKAVYLDNANFYEQVKTDSDLLGTSQITYTSMTSLTGSLQSEVTNNSRHAIEVAVADASSYYEWPKIRLDLAEAVDASMTHFMVDVERTYSTTSFRVQFYDADGNELGNHLHSRNESGWQTVSFKLTEMNKLAMSAENIAKIDYIVITLYFQKGLSAGNAIYLDNANFYEQEADSDLLGTSQITYAANTGLFCGMQSAVTNNSNQAVEVAVNDADHYHRWPTATLQLADAVDTAATLFTVDVERTYADKSFRIEFLDADGVVLGNHLIGSDAKGWQTHTFKLSEMSVDPVLDTELTQIAKIRFTFYFAEGLTAGDAMYIDNASFLIV